MSVVVSVRFSHEELKLLEQEAFKSKKKPSLFVKDCVLTSLNSGIDSAIFNLNLELINIKSTLKKVEKNSEMALKIELAEAIFNDSITPENQTELRQKAKKMALESLRKNNA